MQLGQLRGAVTSWGAAELARRIAARELSAEAAVAAHIARIEAVDGQLNALTQRTFATALEQASAADAALARGDACGPLHGVPYTIKDCFDVAGLDTTLGLTNRVRQPATASGPLVARLRAAGAILLGKTNVPQLMVMHETDNPVFGRTHNPWNLERGPGGSSGGEAAIIAAGGSPLGLGNDLGGSIRQPAHSCGICGFKPTSDRLPRRGCRTAFGAIKVMTAEPGPLARRVEDLELAMRVLVGDGIVADTLPPIPWREPSTVDVAQLRIGYWIDDGSFTPSPAIVRAVGAAANALRQRGAHIEPFAPPDIDQLLPLYMGVISADGTEGLRRLLRGSAVDWRVRRLVRLGSLPRWSRRPIAAALSFSGRRRLAALVRMSGLRSGLECWRLYEQAKQFSLDFFARWNAARLDALVLPPHGLPALRHGTSGDLLSPANYCFLANVLGAPAGVVPVTRVGGDEESVRHVGRDPLDQVAQATEIGSTGLPIGVQVMAHPWRDEVALAVMSALESHFETATDFPHTPLSPHSAS